MSRTAILGSCITRDLWPIRGDGAADLLYISRTSLPSLFSAPVLGFRPSARLPGPLRRHQHRALVADIAKTALAELVAFEPTHIIFDFIDERFDLLSVGDRLITHSWELEASGYLRQGVFKAARPIPRLSDGCDLIWRRGLEKMAALIRATPLRRARLILHSARWAETSRDAAGVRRPLRDVQVLPGKPVELGDHNRLLGAYETLFLDVMPDATLVDAADHRIADEGHQWGLSPFHYIPAYYQDIRRQLEALGVRQAG